MKTKLVPTDIQDPYTGEPLYVEVRVYHPWVAEIRRRWHWLTLFLKIVWRRYDDQCTDRMSIGLAWEIANIVHGKDGAK